MRRHAAHAAALLLLLLVTAGSNGTAQASSSSASSSISSSSSSSSAAFSSTGAACSDAEYTGTCWYQVTCRLCLNRSGCAVEASTGDCVSAADIDSALVGTSYFLAGDAQYCDSSDAACDACMSSGDDSTVCRGSGGCICSSACEQIPASATTCDGDVGKSSQLVLLAASALFFAVLLLVSFKFNTGLGGVIGYLCVEFWRRWRRRRWLRSRQQRNGGDGSGDLQRQSMPPLHLLDGSTAVEGKALTLDGWWKHVSAQEQRFGGVALETCYVQMPRDETDAASSAPTARSTPTDSLPTWDRVGRSTSDSA